MRKIFKIILIIFTIFTLLSPICFASSTIKEQIKKEILTEMKQRKENENIWTKIKKE